MGSRVAGRTLLRRSRRRTRDRIPADKVGWAEGHWMSNRSLYAQPDIVDQYRHDNVLQRPERVVLDMLGPKLADMRMLDIGVGGGRTTLHFAPMAKDYVGIDCSVPMIEACRRRFHDAPAHVSFGIGDLTALDRFENRSFDFILASYNVLDYVSHEERLKVLWEIGRIGRPRGYFCFSSHNVQNIPILFQLKPRLSWSRATHYELLAWLRLRFVHARHINARAARQLPHLVFNDGAHGFGLQTYYVHPLEQLRQLAGLFTDVVVFSHETGQQIPHEALAQADDPWLLPLCHRVNCTLSACASPAPQKQEWGLWQARAWQARAPSAGSDCRPRYTGLRVDAPSPPRFDMMTMTPWSFRRFSIRYCAGVPAPVGKPATTSAFAPAFTAASASAPSESAYA